MLEQETEHMESDHNTLDFGGEDPVGVRMVPCCQGQEKGGLGR